ncbi:MAG: hypothetical protein FJW69_10545 [Actinobacteria bacterium]|nr:hypothetical protein [Actinomycetota bacterium]
MFKISRKTVVAVALVALALFRADRSYAASAFFGGRDFPDLVKQIYIFGSAIVGTVAVAAIVIAGIFYMTSRGNTDKIKKSKEILTGAFVGLFLVLGSYVILKTMNPQLVEFKIEVSEVALRTTIKGEANVALKGDCDPTKDKGTQSVKFTYTDCQIGQDQRHETALSGVYCDTASKKWKIKKGSICGIEHREGLFYGYKSCTACNDDSIDEEEQVDDEICEGGDCEATTESTEKGGFGDVCTGGGGRSVLMRCN